MINIDSESFETFDGVDGKERIPRAPGADLPCNKCPKQSPDMEHLFVLNSANEKLLQLRERLLTSAKYGQSLALSERLRKDPMLADNLATIDEIYEELERKLNAKQIANELAPFLLRH